MRSLEGKYDVVILDCAPGLGVVTESVVMASDLVLAPIIPAPLAVRSLDQLQEFVTTSRDGLPLLAFVSMLDERKVLHRQVLDQIRADGRFSLAAVPTVVVGGADGDGADPGGAGVADTTCPPSRTGASGPRSRTDSTSSRRPRGRS